LISYKQQQLLSLSLKDFTFVCPTEIIAFGDRAPEFAEINTQVIGASCDSKFTHLAWVNTPRSEGGLGDMKIPILADFSKRVANDYGVLINDPTDGDDGAPFRAVFIIDPVGNLRQITMNDLPVGRNVDEVIRLIKAFQFVEKHGEVCPANWQPGDLTMNADPILSKKYFSAANKDEVTGSSSGDSVESVSDVASFKTLIAGSGLTVVDYWAPWCKNCKKISPKFAALASANPSVKFIKVDTAGPGEAIGSENGVDALPTFQFFKGGKKVGEFKGSDASALEAYFKTQI
jgi:peroxiredoxin (alkyl hydroperoxide reductase subunit C)